MAKTYFDGFVRFGQLEFDPARVESYQFQRDEQPTLAVNISGHEHLVVGSDALRYGGGLLAGACKNVHWIAMVTSQVLFGIGNQLLPIKAVSWRQQAEKGYEFGLNDGIIVTAETYEGFIDVTSAPVLCPDLAKLKNDCTLFAEMILGALLLDRTHDIYLNVLHDLDKQLFAAGRIASALAIRSVARRLQEILGPRDLRRELKSTGYSLKIIQCYSEVIFERQFDSGSFWPLAELELFLTEAAAALVVKK